MIRLKYLIFFFLTIPLSLIWAQDNAVTVSGRVTSNGNPVPYAAVYLKNGNLGVNTNIDGQYQLEIPIGEHILEVASQGFRTNSKNSNKLPTKTV